MFRKVIICTFLIVTSLVYGYSEQVVVSQFTSTLKTSGSYSITGLPTVSNSISGNDSGGSLSNTIDFSNTLKNKFSGNLSSMNYTVANANNPEDSIVVPLTGDVNRTEVLNGGVFQLIEKSTNSEGDLITSYLINEKYTLPALSVQSLTPNSLNGGGIEFKYSESTKTKNDNMKYFKLQQFMIRIARQSVSDTNYDIVEHLNGIRNATSKVPNELENSQRFVKGESGVDYIDFFVDLDEYGEIQSEKTESGIGLTFSPGSIQVLGMPTGAYRIEIYSFRYSKDTEDLGNVVITKEKAKDFSISSNRENNALNVMSFSGDKFPNMEATLLSVSSTSSSSISVGELVNSNSYQVDNLVITSDSSLTSGSSIALADGNIVTLDSDNKYNGKYYQKWKVKYKSKYLTIDEFERQVLFTSTPDNTSALAKYQVYSSAQRYDGFPHQTVVGYFKGNINWSGTYEIDDKEMNKYSWGYRNVKLANSNSRVDNINSTPTTVSAIEVGTYGGYTDTTVMTSTLNDWDISGSINKNTVIINKVTGANKGTLTGNNKNFTFYTSDWTPNLKYAEYTTNTAIEATDTATFSWESLESTPYDVVLSEDKIMFRVVYLGTKTAYDNPTESKTYNLPNGTSKAIEMPINYYYTDTNTNPVVDSRGEGNLTSFITNQEKGSYIDFIFKAGQDEERSGNGASFSFSKDNKFIVNGLPRGKYAIQMYSIQNADNIAQTGGAYDYKVITYGAQTVFEMGLPSVMTNDFASQNNIFVINSTNMTEATNPTTGGIVGKVTTLFTTKAQKALGLTTANLVARRDEEISGTAIDILSTTSAVLVTENRQESYITSTGAINLKAATNVALSSTATVEYPLDIVLCIDNSGSMGDEITKVKEGLTNFTSSLKARGFSINFNLMTFGPVQNSSSLDTTGTINFDKVTKDGYFGNGWSTTSGGNTTAYGPYFAQFKKGGNWYNTASSSGGLEELKDDLGRLRATSGFYENKENGAYAIKQGLDYLSSYGRYLSPQNVIVSNSEGKDKPGYLKSTKWVIFMTDEDYSLNYQTDLFNNSGSDFKTSFLNYVASQYGDGKDNPIISGIYNIETAYTDDIGNKGRTPSDTSGESYNTVRDRIGANYFKRYELGNNGNNITNILTYAVETIGKIQTWKLTYDSPFTESKGFKRQSVFSLKDLGTVQSYNPTTSTVQAISLKVKPILRKVDPITSAKIDRFYTETLQRIQASFVNPHKVMINGVDTNCLDIEDGNIVFEALAQSEFKDPIDGKWYNYPITRGTFVVKDMNTGHIETYDSNDSGAGVTIRDEMINSSKWYRVKKKISSASFKAIFGSNPTLAIDFIASTATDTKTISLDVVKLRDMDAPRINKITMTNRTLAEFMRALKTSTGAALFTDEAITGAAVSVQEESTSEISDGTGITALSTSSAINVKAGDSVEIGLVVEDESITTNSAISIVYNNTTYGAIYQGVDGDGASRKTVWSGTIPIVNTSTSPYVIKDQIKYVVEDEGLARNKTTLEGRGFNSVSLLANTTIKPRSNNPSDYNYNPAGSAYSNYYNKQNIESANTASQALAYIVAFEYNNALNDVGATSRTYPSTNQGKKYAGSIDGNFDMGDGVYTYDGNVYVINRAGAIKDVTHLADNNQKYPTIADFDSIVSRIWTSGSTFIVDTIFPRTTTPVLTKVSDANTELNSNSVAVGILNGEGKPYKAGDTINIKTRISETNFLKVLMGNTLTTSSSEIRIDDVVTSVMPSSLSNNDYAISGTAIDLNGTSTTGENTNTVNVAVYDKAGNITTVTLNKNYNDLVPGTLSFASVLTGGGISFTSDSALPLIPISGNNYSVGIANSSYTATVPTAGALNLAGFRSAGSVIPVNEGLNAVNFKAYSKSGVAGITNLSSVVLDRVINDSRRTYTESTYVASGESYTVNLNSFLSTVRELVGLRAYRIRTNSSGVKLDAGGNTSTLTETWSPEIDLSTESRFTNSPSTTAYAIVNNILLSSAGMTRFDIQLIDRLGNTATIDYSVRIPNNISIIGKTNGYSKEVVTKVDGSGTKLKVQSRKE